MPVTIGVSLKMYFGYADALSWCRRVAGVAVRHRAVADGAIEVFVAPTFAALAPAAEILAGTGIQLAAQDVAATELGPYTGEVSALELRELGVTHAEIGHAERRRLFGEDEPVVAAKTAAALRHGLVPGRWRGEAEPGPVDAADAECRRQLRSALGSAEGGTAPVVVAYEPQWAIGAAQPAPDEHIADVCGQLTEALAAQGRPGSRVIYGGSAGPGLLARLGDNVAGLFLGRFAHDPAAFDQVLSEAENRVR